MAGIILSFAFILGLIIICLSLIYFEKFIVATNINNLVVKMSNRLKREAVESFKDLLRTGDGLLSLGLKFAPDNLPCIRSPTQDYFWK